MAWPQATEYGEAVQNLAVNFRDPELIAGQVVCDALGLPVPRSGNFASVFEVRSAAAPQKWAVKCFTKHVPGLQERYHGIDAHLRQQQERLPFMVGFNYLPEGVLVRGQWYAVLKMDWVDGLRLDEFLAECLPKRNYKSVLRTLCEMWGRLAEFLRVAHAAHGDLQHGNVLLVPASEQNRALDLKLIDYDGMYVPELAELPPREVGHPAYQHPERLTTGDYGPEIDRFSHLLIYCTLRCLIAGGRVLWDRHYDGDRLLIGRGDLACPERSAVFRELWNLPDPGAQALVGHLLWALESPLAEVPLLQRVVVNSKIVPLPEDRRRQIERWMGKPNDRRTPQALVQEAEVESLPAARRLTGTDDGWVTSASGPTTGIRSAASRGRGTCREQQFLDWIKADALPGDLYQLVGRPRFDRARDELLCAARECARTLHQLQNLPGQMAERVQQMQLQTAEALSVFSDDGKWRDYDALLVLQLGEQFAVKFGQDATRWRRDSLQRWLAGRDVAPEQLDELVNRVLAGRDVPAPVRPGPDKPGPDKPGPDKPSATRAADFRTKAFQGFRKPPSETPSAAPSSSAAQTNPAVPSGAAKRPRDSSGSLPLSAADTAGGKAAVPPKPGLSRAATPLPAGAGSVVERSAATSSVPVPGARRGPPSLRAGRGRGVRHSTATPSASGSDQTSSRPPAPSSFVPGLIIIGVIVGVAVVAAVILAIVGWFFLLPLLSPAAAVVFPAKLPRPPPRQVESRDGLGRLTDDSPPLRNGWPDS